MKKALILGWIPALFCMASVHEPASIDWSCYQNLTHADVRESSTLPKYSERDSAGRLIEWEDKAARTIRD